MRDVIGLNISSLDFPIHSSDLFSVIFLKILEFFPSFMMGKKGQGLQERVDP